MALIIGRKPVLEAINSDRHIEQIYFRFGQKGGILNNIRAAAKKQKIKISEISSKKFDEIITGKNSQGVAARISERDYISLDELIVQSKTKEFPLFIILEELQDVQNLGAILRTAECSGVEGVIITKRNSAPLNETVSKISAGAVEHLKICQINNVVQSIDALKQNGYWIIGSTLDNSTDY